MRAPALALALFATVAAPSVARADINDKRCILIAASKLPAIRDIRIVAVKVAATTPMMSETGKLVLRRIAELPDALSAKQIVAYYGKITPEHEKLIDSAKGDLQKIRSVTASIMERWTRPELTSTERSLEFFAEYADQKFRFISTCSTAADGTAVATQPTIAD